MASREEALSKIQALKRQLSRSEKLQNDCADLIESRNSLEKKIESLKDEIHQKKLGNSETEPQEKLLRQCLAKQREIDHRLDDLEEWTEEEAERAREKMISLILEIYPGQRDNYNELEANYRQLEGLDRLMTKTEHDARTMIESISEAVRVRNKVRRRGVLSYIFGPNPNVLIAKNLHKIHQIAEEMLKNFPDLTANPAAPENIRVLYKTLKQLLQDLDAKSQERWGFKTLDTTFSEARENLEFFLESHSLEHTALHPKMKSAKIRLDDWIERNSC